MLFSKSKAKDLSECFVYVLLSTDISLKSEFYLQIAEKDPSYRLTKKDYL